MYSSPRHRLVWDVAARATTGAGTAGQLRRRVGTVHPDATHMGLP